MAGKFGKYRAGACSLAIFSAGIAWTQDLMPDGFDEIVDHANQTLAIVDTTEDGMKETLQALTELVEGKVDDPHATYRELQKAVKAQQEQMKDLKAVLKGVNESWGRFSKAWEGMLEKMSDVDRTTSENLRDEVWDRYKTILDNAQSIDESDLRPLQAELESVVRKLDGKLDTAGLASQTTAVEALQERASAWLEDIDQLKKDARTALASLE